MIEQVNEKLYELVNYLDSTNEIKKIGELKRKINDNKDIAKKLEQFRKHNNKYDSKYIELKQSIIEEPAVREYHNLEDELYFLVLEINQKLSSLLIEKSCQL